MTNVMILCS